MSRLITLFILFIPIWTSSPHSLSKKERKACIDYLNENLKSIEHLTKRLSETQLRFRPDNDQWSIKDNIEHLIKVEALVKNIIAKSLTSNEVSGPSQASDDEIRPAMAVRSESSPRYKAPEHIQPDEARMTFAESMAQFREARNETIDYIKSTDDDLRGNFARHPLFKVIDAYQYLIFMGAHTERHILQIKAIIGHEDFPEE